MRDDLLKVELKLEPDYQAPFPSYLGRYTGKPGPNRIDRKLGRLLGEGREHEFRGFSYPPINQGKYLSVDLDDEMPVWLLRGEAEAVRRLLAQPDSDYAVERRRFGRVTVKLWAYAVLQDDLPVKCYDEARQLRYFIPDMFDESPDGLRIAVEDWQRAEQFNDGEWHYLSPEALVTYGGVELARNIGPWVESDSGAADLAEVAGECLLDALAEAGKNIERLMGDGGSVLTQIQAFDTGEFLKSQAAVLEHA